MDQNIYCLEIDVSLEQQEDIDCYLSERIQSGWEEREGSNKQYIIYFESFELARAFNEKLFQRFPDIRSVITTLPEQDWTREWRKYFKPIEVANSFLILPEWESQYRIENRELHPIYIFPSRAFGTGNHPTTCLCMEAIAKLWDQNSIFPGCNFLDVGTGSGILGIACAKLGLRGFGLDCDPDALTNARVNILQNKVQNELDIFTGSLDNIKQGVGFDLVMANLYYRPLLWMAPALVALLNSGAVLILSGILSTQEEQILKAFLNLGLQEVDILRQDNWSAVIYKRDSLS